MSEKPQSPLPADESLDEETNPFLRILRKGDLVRVTSESRYRTSKTKNKNNALGRITKSTPIIDYGSLEGSKEREEQRTLIYDKASIQDDMTFLQSLSRHPYKYDIDWILGGKSHNIYRCELLHTTATSEGLITDASSMRASRKRRKSIPETTTTTVAPEESSKNSSKAIQPSTSSASSGINSKSGIADLSPITVDSKIQNESKTTPGTIGTSSEIGAVAGVTAIATAKSQPIINHMKPRRQKYSNGTVISKLFQDPTTGSHRHYEGIIQSFEFCKDTSRYMYLVWYPEDNDYEHMQERQVSIHLNQWKKRKLKDERKKAAAAAATTTMPAVVHAPNHELLRG